MVDVLAWLSTSLFLLTAFLYLLAFVKIDGRISKAARALLFISVFINIFYMLNLALVFERFPLASLSEAFNFIALSLAIAYILIELITGSTNTGFLILILVSLFKLISLIFVKHTTDVNPILENWYFVLHVIPATLGYTAFALSTIYGILYLALYRELHKKRFGPFYKRLPSLESMESMTRIAVKLGFILLTLGIVAGLPLSKVTFMTFFKWDPKLVVVISIWFIYLAFIIAAAVFSWKGKRYAISSIIGFSLIVFTMVFVELFMKSFHKFV